MYNWIQSQTTFVLSSKELKFDLKKEKIELSACMSAWQTENHNTWVWSETAIALTFDGWTTTGVISGKSKSKQRRDSTTIEAR